MMETAYRLDEYKIIESGLNALRWQAHVGFGAFQEGRCYRKGAILFIGPSEYVRAGFLKGEFLDHLDALPAWLKTPYYCKGCDLYQCDTGNRVTREEMLAWMLERVFVGDGGIDSEPSETPLGKNSGMDQTADTAFRLQRYEIVKKSTGQICWSTSTGPNSAAGGNCLVLEDILFIESFRSKPSHVNKRSFQSNLGRLPRWHQTEYYSPKLSLFDCKSGGRVLSIQKQPGKTFLAKNKQDIVNQKKGPTVAAPEASEKRTFSESASNTVNFLSQSMAKLRTRADALWFKSAARNIPTHIAVFRITRVRRAITCAMAFVLLAITLIFAFLFGYGDDDRKKSDHKKGEHGSRYHRDH